MNPLIHEFYNGVREANSAPLTANGRCKRCGKPVPVAAEERMERNCICWEWAFCPYCGKRVVGSASAGRFDLCEHAVGWTWFSYDKEWGHCATLCRRPEGSFSRWEGAIFAIDHCDEMHGDMWEVLTLEPYYSIIAAPVRSATALAIIAPDIRLRYYYRFYFSPNPNRVVTALRTLEINGLAYLPDEELSHLSPQDS